MRAFAILLGVVMLCGNGWAAAAPAGPEAVKLVLVTDAEPARPKASPGLWETWIHERTLSQTFAVPGLEQPARSDGAGVVAIATGTGSRAAAAVMALGLDARLDLSHAYWIVCGVAAGNPDATGVGGVVWADTVVDGDTAYEVDRADAASDWPYGIVPLGPNVSKASPFAGSAAARVWTLNARLVQKAFSLCEGMPLPDDRDLKHYRAGFGGYEHAVDAPGVSVGGVLGSSRTWHGRVLTHWADDWVSYWTHGKAKFAAADASDQAILGALSNLSASGRADFQRVLILRGIAAYTVSPPNDTRDDALKSGYGGYRAAAHAADLCSLPIIRELLANWGTYGR